MKPEISARVIRWVRPAWLDWRQAETYGGLPPHVLRSLISRRLLRTKQSGKLIGRDSIDRVLLEASLGGPIFWGRRAHLPDQEKRLSSIFSIIIRARNSARPGAVKVLKK